MSTVILAGQRHCITGWYWEKSTLLLLLLGSAAQLDICVSPAHGSYWLINSLAQTGQFLNSETAVSCNPARQIKQVGGTTKTQAFVKMQ